MDVIISVDKKRLKVLVSIHDTFNIDCEPSKEVENLIANTNNDVLDQIKEKLVKYDCKLADKLKWRIVSKYKGYAGAECNIEKI